LKIGVLIAVYKQTEPMRELPNAATKPNTTVIVALIAFALLILMLVFTSCSDSPEDNVAERKLPTAEQIAKLQSKKEQLVSKFERVGDQFKYPSIYLHQDFSPNKDKKIQVSATSDGTLHMTTHQLLYVAIEEHVFLIDFVNKQQGFSSDKNIGFYADSRSINLNKNEAFGDFADLAKFLQPESGNSIKKISLKAVTLRYPGHVLSETDRETIETLEGESVEAFKQTIELAQVFKELKDAKPIRHTTTKSAVSPK
jgi:hypothetical protein